MSQSDRHFNARYLKAMHYQCAYPHCTIAATHCHHIVPLSKGGLDHVANLVALCKPHHLRNRIHSGWQNVELVLATLKHMAERNLHGRYLASPQDLAWAVRNSAPTQAVRFHTGEVMHGAGRSQAGGWSETDQPEDRGRARSGDADALGRTGSARRPNASNTRDFGGSRPTDRSGRTPRLPEVTTSWPIHVCQSQHERDDFLTEDDILQTLEDRRCWPSDFDTVSGMALWGWLPQTVITPHEGRFAIEEFLWHKQHVANVLRYSQ